MTAFQFLLAFLAVYRVAHMVAREDGPVDLFTRMRDKVGQATWYGRGLHCVLCISFWLSFVAVAPLASSLTDFIVGGLAVGGAVVLIHKFFR